MWRSKKFILIAVLAAVLLAGSTVGVVLAQDNGSGTSTAQTIFERVAVILGANGTSVTADQLQTAFTQARTDMRNEAIDSRLKTLVDAGTITQEQADQYRAWLTQRPDMSQIQQQMKDWSQAKPDMPQGLSSGYAPRGGMGRFFMGR